MGFLLNEPTTVPEGWSLGPRAADDPSYRLRLYDSDLERLREVCAAGTAEGERLRALIELLEATGWRLTRALDQTTSSWWKDVRDPVALGWVDLYLRSGRAVLMTGRPPTAALFVSSVGEPWTLPTARMTLSRAFAAAGVPRARAYDFRARYVRRALAEGQSVEDVKKAIRDLKSHEWPVLLP